MPPKKRAKVGTASTPIADSQPKTPVESGSANSPQPEDDVTTDPWTDDQEALLFKNLIRCKPTGIHKHFRMISISQDIESHGYSSSSPTSAHLRIPGIWSKLGQLYDLEVLDEREYNHELSTMPDPLDSETEQEVPEFQLPEDDFADEMWARRLPPTDDERSSSPAEMPELQTSRDELAPIRMGTASVTSEGGKDDPGQMSPPVRSRGSRGGRGRGRAGKGTSTGRGAKAQSNNSVSFSESAEESEEDENEEESSDDAGSTPKAGRTSKRGRPARGRGRKR